MMHYSIKCLCIDKRIREPFELPILTDCNVETFHCHKTVQTLTVLAEQQKQYQETKMHLFACKE